MNAVQILLVAVLVIFAIGRRFAGSPVGSRTMVLPLALTAYGLVQLSQAHHVGAVDAALLAVELLVAVGFGAIRAMTIKLYPKDGHLWQRYGVNTLVAWIVMIAVRLGFGAIAAAMNSSLPLGATIMATFGVSLLIETALVTKRAAATGVPIMPRPMRDQRRGVRTRF